MRLRGARLALLLLSGYALLGVTCDPPLLRATRVASGLVAPIYLTAPAGDARLFVVERRGTIRVIENGIVLPNFFLDIRSMVGQSGEGGLLSLAFSPFYPQDGELYVYYVNTANDSVLDRFVVSAQDRNRVDPASRETVLGVDQPFDNHKGGTIAFSPIDRMLYWALGDGGGADDPNNNAQNPQSLLGKVLRLDVTGGVATYRIPPNNPHVGPDGVLDEIWSRGWRNPFRFSFDRATGNMWIGDVGQGQREEVDFEPAGAGGRNYGWKVHEGTLCYLPQPGLPCDSVPPTPYVFPIHEYATHVGGTCAVTGGVVYRGAAPFLLGSYLFADYCADRIWARLPNGAVMDMTASIRPTAGAIDGVVAFGEDGFADVYLVSLNSGDVHRID
jgi:glucose/arabinose dehydrogenase